MYCSAARWLPCVSYPSRHHSFTPPVLLLPRTRTQRGSSWRDGCATSPALPRSLPSNPFHPFPNDAICIRSYQPRRARACHLVFSGSENETSGCVRGHYRAASMASPVPQLPTYRCCVYIFERHMGLGLMREIHCSTSLSTSSLDFHGINHFFSCTLDWPHLVPSIMLLLFLCLQCASSWVLFFIFGWFMLRFCPFNAVCHVNVDFVLISLLSNCYVYVGLKLSLSNSCLILPSHIESKCIECLPFYSLCSMFFKSCPLHIIHMGVLQLNHKIITILKSYILLVCYSNKNR